MQKIILAIIIVLLIAGAGVAFVVISSFQEQPETPEPGQTGESGNLPGTAFLESLVDRHPEGETYVTELLKAVQELEDQDDSNDFSAALNMGVYLNLLQEQERALEWYQKALAKDPFNLLALNNVANLYGDLGRHDKAEETWLLLVETYPNKTQFWRNLGYLYQYRLYKSSQDIEAFFKRGLEATNNSPDLITWLLSYFQQTGNNEKWVEYANLLNAKE